MVKPEFKPSSNSEAMLLETELHSTCRFARVSEGSQIVTAGDLPWVILALTPSTEHMPST